MKKTNKIWKCIKGPMTIQMNLRKEDLKEKKVKCLSKRFKNKY